MSRRFDAQTLPERGQHVRVSYAYWSYRCPCGGGGSAWVKPSSPTTRCPYQPDGKTTCNRIVRWRRESDGVVEGWVKKVARSVTGQPVVYLTTVQSSRARYDEEVLSWLPGKVTAWQSVAA